MALCVDEANTDILQKVFYEESFHRKLSIAS